MFTRLKHASTALSRCACAACHSLHGRPTRHAETHDAITPQAQRYRAGALACRKFAGANHHGHLAGNLPGNVLPLAMSFCGKEGLWMPPGVGLTTLTMLCCPRPFESFERRSPPLFLLSLERRSLEATFLEEVAALPPPPYRDSYPSCPHAPSSEVLPVCSSALPSLLNTEAPLLLAAGLTDVAASIIFARRCLNSCCVMKPSSRRPCNVVNEFRADSIGTVVVTRHRHRTSSLKSKGRRLRKKCAPLESSPRPHRPRY